MFSEAGERDLDSGQPTPEAPRTNLRPAWNQSKAPFRLEASGEFEHVAVKSLITGWLANPDAPCTGTSEKEFRGAVMLPFNDGRLNLWRQFSNFGASKESQS